MLLTAVPHSSSLQAAERDISDFAYFSDLGRGREELLQHGHKKRVIVAMRGLLHHEHI